MKILVCVKHVPEVTDAEVEIARDGRSIDTDDLAFDMGEWDACAVETAVRLKEEHGGEVTVLTAGDEEAEASLRKGLAMGADAAVRIAVEAPPADPALPARLIAAFARGRGFDLLLTGVMASDLGYGATGPALGGHLDLPHATMIVDLAVREGAAEAVRELEEGLKERIAFSLPAVLAVQTGLAEPRYVSVMGIRKARRIPVEVLEPEDLGTEVSERVRLVGLSPPPPGKDVEILEGTPGEIGARVVDLVREVRP